MGGSGDGMMDEAHLQLLLWAPAKRLDEGVKNRKAKQRIFVLVSIFTIAWRVRGRIVSA